MITILISGTFVCKHLIGAVGLSFYKVATKTVAPNVIHDTAGAWIARIIAPEVGKRSHLFQTIVLGIHAYMLCYIILYYIIFFFRWRSFPWHFESQNSTELICHQEPFLPGPNRLTIPPPLPGSLAVKKKKQQKPCWFQTFLKSGYTQYPPGN